MGTGRNLHYYWSRFQPHRLTAARELRGMTKRALAEKIGKSSSALTQFESGINGIDIQTFTDIVSVLELPAAFLPYNRGMNWSSVPAISGPDVAFHKPPGGRP